MGSVKPKKSESGKPRAKTAKEIRVGLVATRTAFEDELAALSPHAVKELIAEHPGTIGDTMRRFTMVRTIVTTAQALAADGEPWEGKREALGLLIHAAYFLAGAHRSLVSARSAQDFKNAESAFIGGGIGKDNAARMRMVADFLDVSGFGLGPDGLRHDLTTIDPRFARLTDDEIRAAAKRYYSAKDPAKRDIDAVTELCIAALALGATVAATGDTRGSKDASKARRKFRQRVANALGRKS